MSNHGEANWAENLNFKWGKKKRVDDSEKDFQFYQSFMLDNVKYFLYDSVYIYEEGLPEAHIGKLVEMFETRTLGKGVKVVWFFRPVDIRNFLKDYEPSWKEIFLASGEGQGLSNIVPVEAIIGKCNVICTSNDWRNPQASREDLRNADYIFCRTFDVAKYIIEDCFPQKINGVKVEHFFNRINDVELVSPRSSTINDREWTGKSSSSSRLSLKIAVGAFEHGYCGIKGSSVVKERGKAALSVDKQGCFRSYNSALRHEPSLAKSTVEESTEKNIDGVREWTGKSSSSPGLGLEKAVAGGNGGNFGIRVNLVLKGSKKGAFNVDKQAQLPSSNSTLRPKTSVAKCGPGESSGEKIGAKVGHLPNRRQDQVCVRPFNSKANVKQWTGKSSLSSRLRLDKPVDNAVKNGSSGVTVSSRFKESENAAVNVDKQACIARDNITLRPQTSDEGGCGRGRISCCQVENKAKRVLSWDSTPRNASDVPLKKRKLLQDDKASNDLHKSTARLVKNSCTETESLNMGVTKKPNSDRSSWFKQLPWERRLQRAHEDGKLVLLENLDPSFTSSEVEDLVWQALHRRVAAKMLQRTAFSSPHNGRAFVIFESEDVANLALSALKKRCLMLADGRPLVASRGTLPEPGKPASFVGHLLIDKLRLQKQRKEQNVVSTAHFAQPNTLEYEMAMQWCEIQAKSDMWWKMFHERQGKEIEQLQRQLKMKNMIKIDDQN